MPTRFAHVPYVFESVYLQGGQSYTEQLADFGLILMH